MATRTLLFAGLASLFALTTAAASDAIKFYEFECKGIERNKSQLFRTVDTASGPVTHEFKCVDRSCFFWGVEKAGTDDETHFIEHIYILEKEHSYVFSWMVRRGDAEEPVFNYSRVKQLLECAETDAG